eukprot:TRINITY_DN68487_c0_g1_i1.p1 TRINITY_DN68487_c0_g1~~TRINITY_DN68487_c0_g1_i1.p1  ORF type:complete len:464 (-),score=40.59 TRINITY_DN68487_c0_g1_i1:262-1608(-)
MNGPQLHLYHSMMNDLVPDTHSCGIPALEKEQWNPLKPRHPNCHCFKPQLRMALPHFIEKYSKSAEWTSHTTCTSVETRVATPRNINLTTDNTTNTNTTTNDDTQVGTPSSDSDATFLTASPSSADTSCIIIGTPETDVCTPVSLSNSSATFLTGSPGSLSGISLTHLRGLSMKVGTPDSETESFSNLFDCPAWSPGIHFEHDQSSASEGVTNSSFGHSDFGESDTSEFEITTERLRQCNEQHKPESVEVAKIAEQKPTTKAAPQQKSCTSAQALQVAPTKVVVNQKSSAQDVEPATQKAKTVSTIIMPKSNSTSTTIVMQNKSNAVVTQVAAAQKPKAVTQQKLNAAASQAQVATQQAKTVAMPKSNTVSTKIVQVAAQPKKSAWSRVDVTLRTGQVYSGYSKEIWQGQKYTADVFSLAEVDPRTGRLTNATFQVPWATVRNVRMYA